MMKEHSISINDSESSQKTQQDKGKGPADPLANQFDPSKVETWIQPNQRSETLANEEVPTFPLANQFNPSNAETSTHQNKRSKTQAYEAEEGQNEQVANRIPSLDDSIQLLDTRLKDRRKLDIRKRFRGRKSSPACIYKFPPELQFVSLFVQEPEVVSIGPYHRGKKNLLEFEDHKLTFLNAFLLSSEETLACHMKRMKEMEEYARRCYKQESPMSSNDFVEMMLLDGCFIVGFLHLLAGCKDVVRSIEYDFILAVPETIEVLNRDLLKMENQLPFFVLNYLFPLYKDSTGIFKDLPSFALNVFSLSFPMPLDTERKVSNIPLHLLDLVYQTLLPPSLVSHEIDENNHHPSNQPIQSVTQLRLSGITFRSTSKTKSFLEIKYKRQGRVLEIPNITISKYTTCLLINCVAWEQSHQYQVRTFSYIMDYLAFMNVLISEPRDVASLCADGIISIFSQGDRGVVDWLTNFQTNIVSKNRNNYLSGEMRELEGYFSSYWATILRTYFSSPWSFISVLSAFILIACSVIQTSYSIASYYKKHSN